MQVASRAGGIKFRHSPSGVTLCEAKASDKTPADAMLKYSYKVTMSCAERDGIPDTDQWKRLECAKELRRRARVFKPEGSRAAAAAVVARLLDHESFEARGVEWVRHGDRGNMLKIDGVECRAFGEYAAVHGSDPLTAEHVREQQDHTLRIRRGGLTALRTKRDRLFKKGIGIGKSGFDLAAYADDDLASAFVIATVYLFDEMEATVIKVHGSQVGCGPQVDAHCPDSANPYASFDNHIDDHSEADGGPHKKYIEHSVACQCSPGATSMFLVGAGHSPGTDLELNYKGPGSLIVFPAWAPHRSGRAEPPDGTSSLWKLVGFFEAMRRLPP